MRSHVPPLRGPQAEWAVDPCEEAPPWAHLDDAILRGQLDALSRRLGAQQRRIDSLGAELAGEALEREAVFRRHEGEEGREDLVGVGGK
jgi:hypothetical protein